MTDELEVFQRFARHYPAALTDIHTCSPPEPDIRCRCNGLAIAFELVEIIDEGFARANAAMFVLKSDYERYFESLPENVRLPLKESLFNAAIFVTYQDKASLRERRSVIPAVFAFLKQVHITDIGIYVADKIGIQKTVLKTVRILRGNFKGPTWHITTVGLLSEPTIQCLKRKFNKKYVSDADRIELLAFYRFQPRPLPSFIPPTEDFARTTIEQSHFSAVWIYSVPGDNIISHVARPPMTPGL